MDLVNCVFHEDTFITASACSWDVCPYKLLKGLFGRLLDLLIYYLDRLDLLECLETECLFSLANLLLLFWAMPVHRSAYCHFTALLWARKHIGSRLSLYGAAGRWHNVTCYRHGVKMLPIMLLKCCIFKLLEILTYLVQYKIGWKHEKTPNLNRRRRRKTIFKLSYWMIFWLYRLNTILFLCDVKSIT